MEATLYQITDDIVTLDNLFLSMVDEETGEIVGDTEKIEKILCQLKEMLENKSENIIKYVKMLEYNNNIRKQEEARLKKLRDRDDKKIENIKKYVLMNMKKMNSSNIKTSIGNISITHSTSTEIDKSIIPKDERYWTVETTDKFDKKIIKKLIKDGEEIQGAYLVNNENISIK